MLWYILVADVARSEWFVYLVESPALLHLDCKAEFKELTPTGALENYALSGYLITSWLEGRR